MKKLVSMVGLASAVVAAHAAGTGELTALKGADAASGAGEIRTTGWSSITTTG